MYLAILLEYGAFQNLGRIVPLKMGKFRWIERQIWFYLLYHTYIIPDQFSRFHLLTILYPW